MNGAHAFWISFVIFGLVVLFEAGYTIRTDGFTLWAGVRVLGGVLVVGSALWQAIDPQGDPDEMDPGRLAYAAIVGTVLYTTGVVFELL